MRWLHLSVIAIKTFMSSSNTFPSAPGCIALGMKSYSSQRSTNNCISKAWWSMLAPQVKYQLPGKFGVNPRPPVIVQLWLIGGFKLITLPRGGILRKVGMQVHSVEIHTLAELCQSEVLRAFNRLPRVTGRAKAVLCYQRLRNHLLVCVRSPEVVAMWQRNRCRLLTWNRSVAVRWPPWWSLPFSLSSDMKREVSGLLKLFVRWRGLSAGGRPSIQISILGLASGGGSVKGSHTLN